jgi:hypothetical protein
MKQGQLYGEKSFKEPDDEPLRGINGTLSNNFPNQELK